MTNRQVAALAKGLRSLASGFVVRGPLLASVPLGHVLRGIYFEGSSFSKDAFYVWAFCQPLCVPAEAISFNLGQRLKDERGGERWSKTDTALLSHLGEAVGTQGLPFLGKVSSPSGAAALAEERATVSRDPYLLQAAGYLWAAAGRIAEAQAALEALRRTVDGSVTWQQDMATRAAVLTMKFQDGSADEQLRVWEAETARRLGLTDLLEAVK
jgi:hypothetical protein